MTDTPINPDDELVSAVADGEATPAEDARVAADPRLASRLREFFRVTDAITGPVPLVDPDVRDAQIERALAEAGFAAHDDTPTGESPAVLPAVPPPNAPPPPAPVADLAAARAKRNPNRIALGVLSAAAAFVVLAVVGGLVLRAADDTNGGGGDATAAAPAATAPAGAESSDSGSGADEGGGAAADDLATPDSGETFAQQLDDLESFDAATGAPESPADAAVISLGEFDTVSELSSAVAAKVADDPTPTDVDPEEPCRDTLPTEVTLLGRATLDGEEGLVYLETARVPDRRVWIVTAGKGENGCEDLAQVPDL